MRFGRTWIRVRDPEASVRFFRGLGFERRGRLNFETADNLYLGLPGDGETLELTINRDRDQPHEIRDGYNHIALVVGDLDAELAGNGVEPEKPPYWPRRRRAHLLVQDPDGYRVELIARQFQTPRDSD